MCLNSASVGFLSIDAGVDRELAFKPGVASFSMPALTVSQTFGSDLNLDLVCINLN